MVFVLLLQEALCYYDTHKYQYLMHEISFPGNIHARLLGNTRYFVITVKIVSYWLIWSTLVGISTSLRHDLAGIGITVGAICALLDLCALSSNILQMEDCIMFKKKCLRSPKWVAPVRNGTEIKPTNTIKASLYDHKYFTFTTLPLWCLHKELIKQEAVLSLQR